MRNRLNYLAGLINKRARFEDPYGEGGQWKHAIAPAMAMLLGKAIHGDDYGWGKATLYGLGGIGVDAGITAYGAYRDNQKLDEIAAKINRNNEKITRHFGMPGWSAPVVNREDVRDARRKVKQELW